MSGVETDLQLALSESVAPGWDGADGHNSESESNGSWSWPCYIMMTISTHKPPCQRSTQRPLTTPPPR